MYLLLALLLVPQMRWAAGAQARHWRWPHCWCWSLGKRLGRRSNGSSRPYTAAAGGPDGFGAGSFSGACLKCHEGHYVSWKSSYHRSMTREATPENVKADFNDADAVHRYQGITSRVLHAWAIASASMDMIDPLWERGWPGRAALRSTGPAGTALAGSCPLIAWSVRTGSSRMLTLDEQGDGYQRLCRSCITSSRDAGSHLNGAFLMPDKLPYSKKSPSGMRRVSSATTPGPSEPPGPPRRHARWLSDGGGRAGHRLRTSHGAQRAAASSALIKTRLRRLAQYDTRRAGPDHHQSGSALRGARRRHLRTLSQARRCRAWRTGIATPRPIRSSPGGELNRFWLVGWSEVQIRQGFGEGPKAWKMGAANYREAARRPLHLGRRHRP